MPINSFNDAATTTISGSLVVAKDARTGDAGSLTSPSIVSSAPSGTGILLPNSVAIGSLDASGGLTTNILQHSSGDNTQVRAKVGQQVQLQDQSSNNFLVAALTGVTIASGITLTTGNLVLTAGNETLTTGNITLTAGNIVVTSGNISLTTGVIGGGVVAQTIATSPANTIAVTGRSARITGAGIATCALASGTVDGQDLTILNVGAASTVVSTAGFAAVNATLASLACQSFYWDAATTLWYHKA